jgi:hypothetical protein
MDQHWHAYAYTGHRRPEDRDARDPHSATPPHVVSLFFRKPREMLAATFTGADEAYAWLRRELSAYPPPPRAVPASAHLALARDALGRGEDSYTGYYSAGGLFVVRALLVCPRKGERCPSPPP